jgi:hypothetical protein
VAAEFEDEVHRLAHGRAPPEDVAEIDEPVAGGEPRPKSMVQGIEPVRLAMHGGNGPHSTGAAQDGEDVTPGHRATMSQAGTHAQAEARRLWPARLRNAVQENGAAAAVAAAPDVMRP